MQKLTAILIDGGWFANAIRSAINQFPTATVIHKNAKALLGKDEELYRIFYYDSMPYDGTENNPINKRATDYSTTTPYHSRLRLFKELGQMDFIALRRGHVRPRGWQLTEDYLQKLMAGARRIRSKARRRRGRNMNSNWPYFTFWLITVSMSLKVLCLAVADYPRETSRLADSIDALLILALLIWGATVLWR